MKNNYFFLLCGLVLSASSISFNASAQVSPTISSTVNVACFGGSDGSATVSTTGGTSPYTYLWNDPAPAQSTSTCTGLTAGSWTVTVTDTKGLSATAIATINQPAAALSVTTTQTNVSCNGGSNGQAIVTPGGGTSPYTYVWNDPAPAQSTSTVTGLTAGTWTVTVTDNKSCTITTSVTITQPPALTAIPSAVNITCFGLCNGSASVTAGGGTSPYTYLWSGGGTTSIKSSLCAGSYTVTVTDNKGCTTTASSTVTQPTALTVSTSQTNVSCSGSSDGTATATGGGGTSPFTYVWNDPAPAQSTALVTGLTAATWTVTVTDSKGCTTTTTVIITADINSIAASSVTASVNPVCIGNSTVLSVVGGSLGTGASWQWYSSGCGVGFVGSGATLNVTPASTTTYYVRAEGTCNTTSCVSATVTVNTNSTAATSISATTNPICNGNSTTLSVVGGILGSGGAWQWYSGFCGGTFVGTGTSLAVSPSSTTTYYVRAEGTCNTTSCISIAISVNSTSTAASSATASANPVCAGNSTTLSASGGVLGTGAAWQWYSGSCGGTFIGSGSSIAVSPSSTTTYYVRAEGSCNTTTCVSSTVTVNTTSTGASSISVSSNPICSGNSTILTQGGGVLGTGATWKWYSGSCGGVFVVSGASVSVSPVSTTTYYARAEGFCNTTACVSVTITVNAASTEPVANDTTVCSDVAIPYLSSTGTNVQWYSDAALTTLVFTGNPYNTGQTLPGSYTYYVTDNTGACPESPADTVTLTINNAATVNAGIDVGICEGSTTTLSGSYGGGATGSAWISSGTGSFDNAVLLNAVYTSSASDIAAGSATLTLTTNDPDGGGPCNAASDAMILTINPVPVVNLGSDITLCGGGTVLFDAGNPGATYLWSDATTGQTLTVSPSSSATYSVDVTYTNGCSASDTVNVIISTTIPSTVAATDVSSCGLTDGAINLTVSGGTPPYNFSWSNGATTEDIIGLQSGLYFVIVTDANGCTAGKSATITEPPAIALSVIKTDVSTCNGSDGAVDLTVTGGVPPFVFIWSNGTGSEDISNVPAGTYGVTIIDTNGCHANIGVTITQPSSFTINISSVNVNCSYNCNGVLTVTTTGGAVPFTYQWNDPMVQTYQNATGLCAGTYNVQVADANGCMTAGTGTVTAPAALSATLIVNNSTFCGGSDGSVNATLSGGTPPYEYSWSNGSTESTATGLPGGIHYLTALDANNCVVYGTATINDLGGPAISVNSVTDVQCNTQPAGFIDISVSGGVAPYTYLWSTGTMTEDLAGVPGGDYEIVSYDATGCAATQTITVNAPPSLNVSVAAMNASCGSNDGSAWVTVSGGVPPYNFQWSLFSDSNLISGLDAGVYDVTVTDANMCEVVGVAVISNNGAPNVAADSTIHIGCGDSLSGAIYLTVSGGISPYIYLWSNGSTVEDQQNLGAGIYNLMVTDNLGCVVVFSESITQDPPVTDPICMVTVDTATGDNLLVWEKAGLHVAYYNIYREIGQSGNFFQIGTVSAVDESIFLDTVSNPEAKSYRYKLGVIDSCGNESEFLAPVHKTMHLNSSMSGNSIVLHWDPYDGFVYYDLVVFRGTSLFNMAAIDTIPGNVNTYTDTNPPASVMLYYNVAALHPAGCSTTLNKLKTYNASKSNTAATQSPTRKEELQVFGLQFTVYPNPNSEKFTIEMQNAEYRIQNAELRIMNIFGQEVYKTEIRNPKSEVSLPGLSNGIYHYEVVEDGVVVGNGKLVIAY